MFEDVKAQLTTAVSMIEASNANSAKSLARLESSNARIEASLARIEAWTAKLWDELEIGIANEEPLPKKNGPEPS